MSDPIAFTSASPRFALPLLFAGQAQKEVTVNEALLLADLLLHPVVQGTVALPPTTPAPGQCWIVGAGGSGAFGGRDNQLAAWSEGGWRFVAAHEGMRLHDASRGCVTAFIGGEWRVARAPANPTGGAVVDEQARAAIAAIVAALGRTATFWVA